MAKYVIVEFTDDKTVAIVSSTWLGEDSEGNSRCRWPPYGNDSSKANEAVRKHIVQEDWPWFDCVVQQDGTAATYDNARRKLLKAESNWPLVTSDEDTYGIGRKRHAGPPNRYMYNSPEDDSSDDVQTADLKKKKKNSLPLPPPFPDITSPSQTGSDINTPIRTGTTSPRQTISTPTPSGTVGDISILTTSPFTSSRQSGSFITTTPTRTGISRQAVGDISTPTTSPFTSSRQTGSGITTTPTRIGISRQAVSTTKTVSSLQEVDRNDADIVRIMNGIKQQVMQNGNMLKTIINKMTTITNQQGEVEDEEMDVPVTTMEGLEALNTGLEVKKTKKNMVQQLSNLGGNHEKDVIARIMSYIMNDNVAVNLNWKGTGVKRGIEKMLITSVVLRAAKRSSPSSTVASLENCIKNWLKYACDRSGGRKKREEKKKAAAAAADVTATNQDNDRDEHTSSDDE